MTKHLAMFYTWEGTQVEIEKKSTSMTLALAQSHKTIQRCFLIIPCFLVQYSTVLNMKTDPLSLLDLENIQATNRNSSIIKWPQHGRLVSAVWQYGSWSFQTGCTKLERFLLKEIIEFWEPEFWKSIIFIFSVKKIPQIEIIA